MIPIGDELGIGRSAGQSIDLAIDDELLYRQHATSRRMGTSNVYEIVDHDSRNGSFIDGVRMEKARVSDGSILRLGVNVFELTVGSVKAGGERIEAGKDRDALVGRSVQFQSTLAKLQAAIDGGAPVVLTGAPGTGKTMAAGFLHRENGRNGPLLVVGCGRAEPRLAEVDLVGGQNPDDPAEHVDGYLVNCAHGTPLFDDVDLREPALQKFLLEIIRIREGSPDEGPFFSSMAAARGGV